MFLVGLLLSCVAHPADSNLKLTYDTPAADWTHALPLGNGRIGAMDFGETREEPEGTRAELIEFELAEKPCCSPFLPPSPSRERSKVIVVPSYHISYALPQKQQALPGSVSTKSPAKRADARKPHP